MCEDNVNANLFGLIRSWESEIRALRDEHALSARFYEKLHWRLGLPSVVVTALLGATVWTEGDGWISAPALKLIAGVLSLIVLVLNAAHTFLKTDERSNRHKSTYDRYDGLLRELQLVCVLRGNVAELRVFVTDFHQRWSKICAEAPTLRDSTFKRIAGIRR